MKIRPAELIDIEVISSLSQQAFDYDEQFDSTLNMSWSKSEEAHTYFNEKIQAQDALLILAWVEAAPIGYLVGSYGDAEDYRCSLRIAEIEVLFVAEAHRSSGAGAALVHEFNQWAKSANAIELR